MLTYADVCWRVSTLGLCKSLSCDLSQHMYKHREREVVYTCVRKDPGICVQSLSLSLSLSVSLLSLRNQNYPWIVSELSRMCLQSIGHTAWMIASTLWCQEFQDTLKLSSLFSITTHTENTTCRDNIKTETGRDMQSHDKKREIEVSRPEKKRNISMKTTKRGI